ncbi:hypothetical protein [Thermosipho africanus]|jgi:hypothetical protein|nr:hypothetical protein [Thermosipho africanus]
MLPISKKRMKDSWFEELSYGVLMAEQLDFLLDGDCRKGRSV